MLNCAEGFSRKKVVEEKEKSHDRQEKKSEMRRLLFSSFPRYAYAAVHRAVIK